MAWNARSLAGLTGKTYVVTGATSGIGTETARELVAHGAHVVLAARDLERAGKLRDALAGRGTGRATVVPLDLADLDSVAACAAELSSEHEMLHGLVCNAGIMGGPFGLTRQGFERQMGTNHLGHAALVAALWPRVEAAAGRVVLVSSIAARGGRLSATTTRDELVLPSPYIANLVYASTKQANLLFAQELHRRAVAAHSPVAVVACHPGVIYTELFGRQLRERRLAPLVPVAALVGKAVLASPAYGALATLRALDPSTPSGSFVGPSRLGQSRGPIELLDVYPQGRDEASAKRLWELTEELLERPLPPG